MTVASIYLPRQYIGDGVNRAFSFPFPFSALDDIDVLLVDTSAGTTVPVRNGGGTYDFVVAGTVDGGGTGDYLNATVTLNSAPPATTTITLQRSVSTTQETQLSDNGPFPAKTIEGTFDRIVMALQQLASTSIRALLAPIGEPGTTVLTLPPATARAGKILTFDSQGNATAGALPAGNVAISSPMVSVVGAASVAVATALLGAVSVATTVATLRANAVAARPVIWVEGYSAAADGGEGSFVAVTSDTTSADNGGTIIVDAAGTRWYRAAAGRSLDLRWFGAKPDGSDSAPALNAALAALPSGGGKIKGGAGTWTFNSTSSFVLPGTAFSLSLEGDGAGNTIFYWPTGNGIALTGSTPNHTVHARDMTFRTATQGAYSAITLTHSSPGGNFAQTDFTRVTFDGVNQATQWWLNGIKVSAWCNIAYDTILGYGGASGNGVSLAGNAATSFRYSVVHNFSKCGFFGTGNGIVYGDYVQGVSVSQSNFTNGTTGILVPAGAVGSLSELNVSQCQFGVTGTAIEVDSPLSEMCSVANLFIPEASTIAINATAALAFSTIVGNQFPATSNVGTVAVQLFAASNNNTVTGNVFQGLNIGVALGASSTGNNVQSNKYPNCNVAVSNSGTGNTIGGGST